MKLHDATYAAILTGSALWCLALIAAPVLAAYGGMSVGFSKVLYSFFHTICHQLDARSYHLFNEPLAVCSRCTSIYFAFLFGAIVYPFVRSIRHPVVPSRVWLLWAITPMAVDILAGFLGLHETTNATRTITGSFFGFMVAFVTIPVAIESVEQMATMFLSTARKGARGV